MTKHEALFRNLETAKAFRNRCDKIHLIVREGAWFAVVLPTQINARPIEA